MIKRFVFGMMLIIGLPGTLLAESGNPVVRFSFNYKILGTLPYDSVVPPKKNDASNRENTDQNVIKEVPKARRQPVPLPVTVKVKPVKIIKPKITRPRIIKPVINVIH
jgi:hypothetical protein